ncbi:hypothetical protein LOK74_01955 [Brevibacillus humidisoli]|uniref:hypothetical protein n=1 Tax=Brevibacillus humidisoli TaxID=2895522 RepID=UPI001E2D8E39|nr:hypothetical protein [Brevibacillus humidisoli]UFJ41324.1 hypothetical protein LOK74_01955 [Brevibacillus humidisoli]
MSKKMCKLILIPALTLSMITCYGFPQSFQVQKAYAAAPAAPVNLYVSDYSNEDHSKVTITFEKSGVGITHFNIYVDGTKVGTVPSSSSTTYSYAIDSSVVTNLHKIGQHDIGVSAVNAAGEESSIVHTSVPGILLPDGNYPYPPDVTYVSPSGVQYTGTVRYNDPKYAAGEYVAKNQTHVVYLPTGEEVDVLAQVENLVGKRYNWEFTLEGVTEAGHAIVLLHENDSPSRVYVYSVVQGKITLTVYGIDDVTLGPDISVAFDSKREHLAVHHRYRSSTAENIKSKVELYDLTTSQRLLSWERKYGFDDDMYLVDQTLIVDEVQSSGHHVWSVDLATGTYGDSIWTDSGISPIGNTGYFVFGNAYLATDSDIKGYQVVETGEGAFPEQVFVIPTEYFELHLLSNDPTKVPFTVRRDGEDRTRLYNLVDPALSLPDPTITLDKSTLQEDVANDGSVSEKLVVRLSDGTFTTDVESGVTVDNVPAGLTTNVVRASDAQLEITFDGRATIHGDVNDISNVQVTIAKEKVTGAANDLVAAFGIDFIDPYATISLNQATIQEATENDGSVSEKQVITVTNGKFASDILDGVHVNNLPNGLTANVARISDTQVELSFTGKATNHRAADSVSAVQVIVDQSKVTGANEDLSATFGIQFSDPDPLDMPTLKTQESTAYGVTLEINQVNGASTYKVKRQDSEVVQTLENLIFQDDTVLPARQYTYEFWADNGSESPHNTVTLWTKPVEPSVQVANVNDSSVTLAVDLKDNPSDIVVEVRREGGNPVVNGTEISETSLKPNTSYTYEVRLKSANNEYTAWVTKEVQTTADPLAPTYDTVKDVTVDMGDDGNIDIGGIKNPNDQLRYSIAVKKSGNVIATSPLVAVITELEDWLEEQLERNTKYEIVFGAQKGSDASTRVEKTIILITPPAFVTEENVTVVVTEETATIDLSQIGNPVGSVYQVTVDSEQGTGTNQVELNGLDAGTAYTAQIKVMRPDSTWMSIGSVAFKTQGEAVVTPPSSQPTPDEREQKFQEEVQAAAGTFDYVTDGEPNSGKAYIEMKIGSTNLTVTATVNGANGKSVNVSTTPVRIEELEDNEEYTLVVSYSDGEFTESREYKITTPNRTPPKVEKVYLQQDDFILEVISKNGIKH